MSEDKNKRKDKLKEAMLAVFGFDKLDVISITKEEFEANLPILNLYFHAEMMSGFVSGMDRLNKVMSNEDKK